VPGPRGLGPGHRGARDLSRERRPIKNLPCASSAWTCWLRRDGRVPAHAGGGAARCSQPGQYVDVMLTMAAAQAFRSQARRTIPRSSRFTWRRRGGEFTESVFTTMEAEGAPAHRRDRSASSSIARMPGGGLVLIAGGTGFAPLKSMLRHASSGDRSVVSFLLGRAPSRRSYGARAGWTGGRRRLSQLEISPCSPTSEADDPWPGRKDGCTTRRSSKKFARASDRLRGAARRR